MDVGRYDSRDGGGRTASGTAVENNAGAIVEHHVLYQIRFIELEHLNF